MDSKPVVLCVDDDMTQLILRAAILRMAGCDVVSVQTAFRALALVQLVSFTVIVLDYNMPSMNGAACARQIRASHPGLPLILLSAAVEIPPSDLSCFDRHIRKCAKPYDLVEAVRQCNGRDTLCSAPKREDA